VKGLGETLVGAYSGRALSFIAKKANIKSPKVGASSQHEKISTKNNFNNTS
jgi:hypothetical protein